MFMMHFTGVSLKAWKAKEGECEEKCEEAGAGPIFIVRECEPETGFSCKGHKTTKEAEECTKYCSSTGRMKQFYIIRQTPLCGKQQTKCLSVRSATANSYSRYSFIK